MPRRAAARRFASSIPTGRRKAPGPSPARASTCATRRSTSTSRAMGATASQWTRLRATTMKSRRRTTTGSPRSTGARSPSGACRSRFPTSIATTSTSTIIKARSFPRRGISASWAMSACRDATSSSLRARTPPRSAGVTLGLKLPTGKHDVANDEGEEAERTLQPGTGTTEFILGAYCHGAAPLAGYSWFARAQGVVPMNTRDGYKPGRQLGLDVGLRYAVGRDLGAMVQLNYLAKGRDSGVNAEPDDSGQLQAFLSPGMSWNFSPDAPLYGFVQVPLYQAVNGVQLTARWSALAGFWRLLCCCAKPYLSVSRPGFLSGGL